MAKSFPNTGATVIDSAADFPVSNLFEGQLVIDKNVNKGYVYTGSAWLEVFDYNPRPFFSGYGSNITTITSTQTINKPSVITNNVANCYNATTGLFTVPTNGAGAYHITSSFGLYSNSNVRYTQLVLKLNGSDYNFVAGSSANSATGTNTQALATMSIIIPNLVAGDTLGCYFVCGDNNGTLYSSHQSIYRIGPTP